MMRWIEKRSAHDEPTKFQGEYIQRVGYLNFWVNAGRQDSCKAAWLLENILVGGHGEESTLDAGLTFSFMALGFGTRTLKKFKKKYYTREKWIPLRLKLAYSSWATWRKRGISKITSIKNEEYFTMKKNKKTNEAKSSF